MKTDKRKKRLLLRRLDRQRRAKNPQNSDHKARVKKGKWRWKESRGYKATRRRLASQERKIAAHRKSLHGQLVHEVVACGTTVITEKLPIDHFHASLCREDMRLSVSFALTGLTESEKRK